MKNNEGFWPKSQISPIGKIYLEFGLKYKPILDHGWKMAQNVPSSCTDTGNWARGFKRYEPTSPFLNMAHPGSLMSYYKKRWGK